MNIRETKEELINTVKLYLQCDEKGDPVIPVLQQRPVLLIGPPGVGKTAIVRQAADECGVGLVSYTITHHTRQTAVGLPVVKTEEYLGREYTVTEYTMSEIIASVYQCMEETGVRNGILFIDEINCVSETLLPTMLQFLQSKTFGTHRVPDGWIIVAAGNPPEYNRSARNFDIVTLDRVRTINVDISFDVWKGYAQQKGVHETVLSYLASKPDHFYYIEEGRGERDYVTARGWDDLACFLAACEGAGLSLDAQKVREFLHSDKIAEDFLAYYRMTVTFRRQYRTGEILDGTLDDEELAGQKKMMSAASLDEQYYVAQMLLSALAARMSGEARTRALLTRRKELADRLEDLSRVPGAGPADEVLADLTDHTDHALRVRYEHRIISDSDRSIEKEAVAWLVRLRYDMKEQRVTDAAEAAAKAKEALAEEERDYSRYCEDLSAGLERCFVYLEDAAGASDILGYFMTALSADPQAQDFLGRYRSEGFARHLDLLSMSREEELLRRELEELGGAGPV